MHYQMLRTTATTFSITNLATGAVVFTGELAAVMKEFSRLNLQAKGMAKSGTKMQRREKKRMAGVR